MAEMKKKVIDELHVLVGLPGSGKSTFADEYREYSLFSENYRYYSRKNGKKLGDIIDFDTIFKKAGFKDGLNLNYEKAASHIPYKVKYPILILDGLFVTQKEVEWVLDIYFNSDKFKNRLDIRKIVIDYYSKDDLDRIYEILNK